MFHFEKDYNKNAYLLFSFEFKTSELCRDKKVISKFIYTELNTFQACSCIV